MASVDGGDGARSGECCERWWGDDVGGWAVAVRGGGVLNSVVVGVVEDDG